MKHTNITSAAIVVLLGSAAMAQTDKPQPQGDKPNPRAAQPAATSNTQFLCHKASDVMGAKVRVQAGEVGKIEDIIVDPTSGRIEYAVISMSGERAKGNQWYAVPFTLFVPTAMADGQTDKKRDMKTDFNLNIDTARLQNAPAFSKDKWPDVNAPTWRTEIDKHYGAPRNDEGTARSGDTITQRRACRASELMGKDLVTTSNDEVGEIKELAIDARGARIPYVVISSGGFLGMGDKLHAIPWEAIQMTPEAGKDKLIVNLAKDRVLKAPEFKNEDWGRMSDRTWVADLYTYYGFKPYWSNTTDAGFKDPREGAPREDKDKDAKKEKKEKDGDRPNPDKKDPH